MTKKDIIKIEEIVQKILKDMLYEIEPISLQGEDEAIFPMAMLQEMEAYIGHPIDFMGIS